MTDNSISIAAFKVAAGVERISQVKAVDHERAVQWLDKVIAARKRK